MIVEEGLYKLGMVTGALFVSLGLVIALCLAISILSQLRKEQRKKANIDSILHLAFRYSSINRPAQLAFEYVELIAGKGWPLDLETMRRLLLQGEREEEAIRDHSGFPPFRSGCTCAVRAGTNEIILHCVVCELEKTEREEAEKILYQKGQRGGMVFSKKTGMKKCDHPKEFHCPSCSTIKLRPRDKTN